MFVKDYENGFQCYVPDEFSEIKKENYESWNVAESTLHYFVELDEDGEVWKAVSINLLDDAESEEEFAEVVDKNVKDIESLDFEIVEVEDFKLPNDRVVKRVLSKDKDDENLFVTYFMNISKHVICSTIMIAEEYDEEETIVATIYSSMKEI